MSVQHKNRMGGNKEKIGDFQPLFENLSHVIAVSRHKFDLPKIRDREKQRWARLLITGCEAYAKLLEASKLDEIEVRLTKLEEKK